MKRYQWLLVGILDTIGYILTGYEAKSPATSGTVPLMAGVRQAETIFNLVFFIVLTSVLLQGSTIPLVARWLHVAGQCTYVRARPLSLNPPTGFEGNLLS